MFEKLKKLFSLSFQFDWFLSKKVWKINPKSNPKSSCIFITEQQTTQEDRTRFHFDQSTAYTERLSHIQKRMFEGEGGDGGGGCLIN